MVLLDHDLILGQNVLHELEKALREKIKLPMIRSAEIVEFVSSAASQVVDGAKPAIGDVDTADALVLGEALATHADLFVTGDAALLRLAAVGALKIMSVTFLLVVFASAVNGVLLAMDRRLHFRA